MARLAMAVWLAAAAACVSGCGGAAPLEPTDLFGQLRVGMSPGEANQVLQEHSKAEWPLFPGQTAMVIQQKPFKVERAAVDGKTRETRQYRTSVGRYNMGVRTTTEGPSVELVFEEGRLVCWRTAQRPFIPVEPAESTAP